MKRGDCVQLADWSVLSSLNPPFHPDNMWLASRWVVITNIHDDGRLGFAVDGKHFTSSITEFVKGTTMNVSIIKELFAKHRQLILTLGALYLLDYFILDGEIAGRTKAIARRMADKLLAVVDRLVGAP